MKIQFKKCGGNVLFGTLFITGMICVYLGSYLSLVRNENTTTARSQTWNAAIPLAEAGIEEAMTHLQTTFPNFVAAHGWNFSGNNLAKLRVLNANEKFYTLIYPNGGNPIIESTGFARPALDTNFISRTIRVTTTTTSYSFRGMLLREGARLNGNKITFDSFDSSTNAYSTGGRYDPLKRRDNAILATLSTNGAIIDLGNADIWGKVASAHAIGGSTPPITGPNSVVGNTAWHNSGKKGIQAGAYTDDLNMTIESVTTTFPGKAPVKGKNVSYWELGTGSSTVASDYVYHGPTFGGSVRVSGKVRLLVNANVSFGSKDTLIIEPGGSLEMYVAGASADLGGQMINTDGFASNFKYFGLPSNKSLSVGGGNSFTAVIYAPEADLTLGGGGGETSFSGACVANSARFNGSYNFHYDESAKNELKKGYIITSWREDF